MIKKLTLILTLTLIVIGMNSCEDASPNQFLEQTIVQGYLLVDKPINGILISRTTPIDQKIDNLASQIKDAKVQIYYMNPTTNKTDTINLQFKDTDEIGYFNPEQNTKVLPNTLYNLKVQLTNGNIITGQTLTPIRFNWVKQSDYKIYYPKDTLKLPRNPEYDISWTKESKVNFYFLRTLCHDTLEYGKYFETPEPDNKNRRCYNLMSQMNEEQKHSYYKNATNWNLLGDSITPFVWMAFKWFGKHEIIILAPDYPMLKGYVQNMMKNQYDPNLSNIKGGNGHFGSASAIKDTFMLLKNLP